MNYPDGWYRVVWDSKHNNYYKGIIRIVNNDPVQLLQTTPHGAYTATSVSTGWATKSWKNALNETPDTGVGKLTFIPISDEEATMMLITGHIPDEMPTV